MTTRSCECEPTEEKLVPCNDSHTKNFLQDLVKHGENEENYFLVMDFIYFPN